jgi:hypothetical protein
MKKSFEEIINDAFKEAPFLNLNKKFMILIKI